MITVIAKLKVKVGREADFERAAREMVAHVKANEPNTQAYVLHRSTGDPTEFLFYEVYADQAAFALHGGSEAMQRFFGQLSGIVDGRPEIALYEAIAGKS